LRNYYSECDDEYDVPWEKDLGCYGVAINGKAFSFLLQEKEKNSIVIKKILQKTQVFARMSPDDKANLVRSLQDEMKVMVGMCGDGANDCGALK